MAFNIQYAKAFCVFDLLVSSTLLPELLGMIAATWQVTHNAPGVNIRQTVRLLYFFMVKKKKNNTRPTCSNWSVDLSHWDRRSNQLKVYSNLIMDVFKLSDAISHYFLNVNRLQMSNIVQHLTYWFSYIGCLARELS